MVLFELQQRFNVTFWTNCASPLKASIFHSSKLIKRRKTEMLFTFPDEARIKSKGSSSKKKMKESSNNNKMKESSNNNKIYSFFRKVITLNINMWRSFLNCECEHVWFVWPGLLKCVAFLASRSSLQRRHKMKHEMQCLLDYFAKFLSFLRYA